MVIYSKPSITTRICIANHQKTLKVRNEIIRRLSALLDLEVCNEEQCEVKLVCCPIVSRAGTDIEAALCRLSSDKPTVVIVLHHTFDPDSVVPCSSRYDQHNLMMVDAFFHEDEGLLQGPKNNEMLNKTADFLKQHGHQSVKPDHPVLLSRIWENILPVLPILLHTGSCAWSLGKILYIIKASTINNQVSNKKESWSKTLMNSFIKHWSLCIASMAVLYTGKPCKQNSIPQNIPDCWRNDWLLWTACLAVTLHAVVRNKASLNRSILKSMKRYLNLWTACMATDLKPKEACKEELEAKKIMNYLKKFWPFWTACILITLHDAVHKRLRRSRNTVF